MHTLSRFVISVLFVVFVNTALPLTARAQTPSPSPAPTTTNTGDYEFVAQKDWSLSLVVRRALQLYDTQTNELTLSPGQAMYAETNIVNRKGARLLNLNERVTVEGALIEEYARKSQTLSAETVAAWQTYANRANFNLSHVSPVSSPSNTSSTTTPSQTPSAADDQSPTKTEDQSSEGQRPSSSTDSALFWTLIGLATVGILYYLLSSNPERR